MFIFMEEDKESDRYLIHYGVKGMRWGVRKDRAPRSSFAERRQARKEASINRKREKALDRHTSARYTYKQRKHLTDSELRTRINRLSMEKQLKDLSRSEGHSFELIAIDNGQRAARQALGKYGAKAALAAIGLGGAADFIRPKK